MSENLPVTSTKIVEYSATAAGLADLRHRLEGVVFEVQTKEGMEAARKGRRECRELRVALEDKRVEIKAPALERARLIDAEAKSIKEAIEAIEDPIDAQIKAEEARVVAAKEEAERLERNRLAEIRAKVEAIAMIPLQVAGKPAKTIEEILAKLRARELTVEEFQEFAGEAAAAKIGALEKLELMIEQAKANEKEAARLEAERKELEARQREQTEREERERKRLEEDARIRRAIDELFVLATKYAGMPSADIEEQIRKLKAARAIAADEVGQDEFRLFLGDRLDEWLAACDKVVGQLEASANLSRAQEREAAAAKTRAEREKALSAGRGLIAAVSAAPAQFIGSEASVVEIALKAMRLDLTGEAPPVPDELAAEWRAAAEKSAAQLERLLEEAKERELRLEEDAARLREKLELERKAREHAAMEEEQRKADADAVRALETIASIAADLGGIPDNGIARSRIAGVAAGTLEKIAAAKKTKPRKPSKPSELVEARQAELRG